MSTASITNKLTEEATCGDPPGVARGWELTFTGPSPAPGVPPATFTLQCDLSVTLRQWKALAAPQTSATVNLVNPQDELWWAVVSRERSSCGDEWFEVRAHLIENTEDAKNCTLQFAIPTTPALDAQLRAAAEEGHAWLAGAAADC